MNPRQNWYWILGGAVVLVVVLAFVGQFTGFLKFQAPAPPGTQPAPKNGENVADMIIVNGTVALSPQSPTTETSISFGATVKNQGNANAVASTTLFQVDYGNTGKQANYDKEFSVQTKALAPDESVRVTWSAGQLPAGTHRLKVCSDVPRNDVSELGYEGQNCNEWNGDEFTFTVTGGAKQPDLIVIEPNYDPKPPSVGSSVKFAGSIKNNTVGSNVGESVARLRIDVGNNGSWDVTPATQTVTARAGGTAERKTWNAAWTATAGTHAYEICADTGNTVTESNETNNCTKQTFTVGAAAASGNNAECAGITAPDSVQPGARFSATVNVKNVGTKEWTTDADGRTIHRLGAENPRDTNRWSIRRVSLPSSPISNGQTAAFSFTATAPTAIGSYAFAWRMVEEFVEWFGPICEKSIEVKAGAEASSPSPVAAAPSPECSDGTDNDGDGKIDDRDPGCHTDGDVNNASSYDPNDDSERDTAVARATPRAAAPVTTEAAPSGERPATPVSTRTGASPLSLPGLGVTAISLASAAAWFVRKRMR
jgi:CARDB protein/Ig-like domain-containing protein